MSKLTEREIIQLERIKEKLQKHRSELKSAQSALRRLSQDDFSDSPIDLHVDLEPDVLVDDMDLFLEDISEAIDMIDSAVEEYENAE